MTQTFLPVTREEMLERGWEQPDFVYVSGDAYVDHPSFGAAIITRVLEAKGYKFAGFTSDSGLDNFDILKTNKPLSREVIVC